MWTSWFVLDIPPLGNPIHWPPLAASFHLDGRTPSSCPWTASSSMLPWQLLSLPHEPSPAMGRGNSSSGWGIYILGSYTLISIYISSVDNLLFFLKLCGTCRPTKGEGTFARCSLTDCKQPGGSNGTDFKELSGRAIFARGKWTIPNSVRMDFSLDVMRWDSHGKVPHVFLHP